MLVVRTHEKLVRMNRSRYEIIAEITQNCLSPRSKTSIMYKGNLSFAQANAYLSLLTSLGLLSQENGKYETTDKGRQFISAYNQLGKIIGIHALSLTEMAVFSSSSAIARALTLEYHSSKNNPENCGPNHTSRSAKNSPGI